MKYKKTNAFVINKISVMLLVLALCMSLVMPMAGINVYAGNEDKSVAAEEIQKDADAKESTKEADTEKTGTDTSRSEKKAKTAKIQTTITGYQTSYNKRYNQDLLIEADITPADGRDVQLQRYNSEEDSWTTILTASPAPDPVTEPEENSEETYITDKAGQGVLPEEGESVKNEKVNINTAKQTELETLTGIGPSTALKIINYRNKNGEFESIEDIKNVPGIGDSKFENIKEDICI